MSGVSKLSCVVVAALALALCVTGAAQAQLNNPVGLWNVQAYNDNSPNLAIMGNQNICFVAGGTWYSTTFPAWNGRWFQKGNNAGGNGDRIRIIGNYANGVGNDSAEMDYVNLNLMTGPWNEWRDGFPFFLWARIVGTRLGNNCPPPALQDIETVVDDGRNPAEDKGSAPPTCVQF